MQKRSGAARCARQITGAAVIEGVILEAANSMGLRVVTGALTSISKNLGTKAAKHYLEGNDLRGLDWSRYPAKNVREAILVAASALRR